MEASTKEIIRDNEGNRKGQLEYYYRNREKILKRQKEKYEANKEAILAKAKKRNDERKRLAELGKKMLELTNKTD